MMNATLTSLAAGACLALAAFGAHAQANTGSLNGWSVYGDASAANGAITLTTAYMDGGPDQAGNISGNSAVGYLPLTAALGLPATALDLPEEEATEGSMVVQSFNLGVGQYFSFRYTFTTSEALFSDRAYVSINGQIITLATSREPGVPMMGIIHQPLIPGLMKLGIGVIDTGDYNGVSRLSITDLQILTVPEPANAAMMLAGLCAVGGLARARRRAPHVAV